MLFQSICVIAIVACSTGRYQDEDFLDRFLVSKQVDQSSLSAEYQIFNQMMNLIEADPTITMLFEDEELSELRNLNSRVLGPYTLATMRGQQEGLDLVWDEVQTRARTSLPELVTRIGKERVDLIVFRANKQWMRGFAEGSPDVYSIFANQTLSDLWSISDSQKSDADEAIGAFKKEQTTLRATAFDEIEASRKALFEKIQLKLSKQQNYELKNLIGRPLNVRLWTNEKFDEKTQVYENMKNAAPIDVSWRTKSDNAQDEPKSSPDETAATISTIDYLTKGLLVSKTARTEMELTEEQVARLDRLVNGERGDVTVTFNNSRKRLEVLVAPDERSDLFPKQLVDILLPHQLVWLRQVEVQFRTAATFSSFGVLDPLVSTALNLSPTQITGIKRLVGQHEMELATIKKELDVDLKRLTEKAKHSLLELLSDEQRSLLDQFAGDMNK